MHHFSEIPKVYVCTAVDSRHRKVDGLDYAAAYSLNSWVALIFGEDVCRKMWKRSPVAKVEYLLEHAGVLVEPVAGKNQNKGVER